MAVMNWLPRGSGSGGGGGTGNKMNIFVQPTEPDIKEGIWIETDKPVPLDIVVVSDMSDLYGEYDYTQMRDIPYAFYGGSTSVVGDDVYLFGSGITNTGTNCYKYDTTSNTYTKMIDIPHDEFSGGSTSVVGDDVYLFGGPNTRTNCYKYNTTSNTYTKMLDIPYAFYGGSTSVVGTDIYLFGGNNNNCYKYDTISNTYTKMIDVPYTFYFGSTSVIGNDIYLFGSYDTTTRKYCYKYDTILNTYTKMRDIPYEFHHGSTSVVGDDVYLFGGGDNTATRTNCYKYDTILNTYTKMLDTPYEFYYGSTPVVGDDVYLFGGGNTDTLTNCYKFSKTIIVDNDTFVIIKSSAHDGLYQTQFFQPPRDINPDYIGRIVSGFDDALLYADNTVQDSLPTYYGNGTEWIKFKN